MEAGPVIQSSLLLQADDVLPSAISASATSVFIPVSCVIGIVFALSLWVIVAKVKVRRVQAGGHADSLVDDGELLDRVASIQEAIQEGSSAFLGKMYQYIGAFIVPFALIIFLFLGSIDNFSTEWKECGPKDDRRLCAPCLASAGFSTLAFLLGAGTSVLCGYMGMKIATYANARVALEARWGISQPFVVAFRSGAVMGFLLTSTGLLVLYVTIALFRKYFGEDWGGLYEAITGYGLGGSAIALFGRVGGGIFTKAADVGADLVGKVEKNIPEDDPRNPATIADNVGDNVGDIAGMGADLFGSFAESTCAALVISGLSSLGASHQEAAMSFPLMISAAGILMCLATSLVATNLRVVKTIPEIQTSLKHQLLISTVLMTPAVYAVATLTLPAEFTIAVSEEEVKHVKNWYVFFCVASGLWAGLAIGYITEYYTSNTYSPVRLVAKACSTGAATNIIFGLALGYMSVVIPAFAIAATIYLSYSLAAMYGIACAALGMLSTLCTGLTIDAYGPISDNAGGLAEMSEMGEEIRERTDALDAAGNTTAAIGKGFAIGSAALVSLALFGAFATRAGVTSVNIMHPEEFAGLLIGAMLPYWFSAMTMKSVGQAALAMVQEVRRQFAENPGILTYESRPDYKRCVAISTEASIKEMIPPGALVMLSPVIMGTLMGTKPLAGMLAGALVSGVQMAISAANAGGAWDNSKKFIEAGACEEARALGGKGSGAHAASVIGDTVGDPLKDTSGPSLNILIKLMAVESLVLAPFFATHGGILFRLFS
eukprot:jgi/Mesvir1/16462/Mv03882-RA.1